MANYKSGAHEYTFSNESGDNGLEIYLHPKLYIQVSIITFFNYGWRGLLLELRLKYFEFFYHVLIGLYRLQCPNFFINIGTQSFINISTFYQ